jgi:hypothetical protein
VAEKEKTDKYPERKWVPARDGSIHEIYGNFTHVSWTLFDVRIRVGQLVPSEEEPKEFVVEERAAITLAWPQAKFFCNVLSKIVASFEETNGEIKPLKLPPDPTVGPTK